MKKYEEVVLKILYWGQQDIVTTSVPDLTEDSPFSGADFGF